MVKWAWVIAVIVFVGIYFHKHLPEEMEYLKSIRMGNILLSVGLLIIGKLAVVELARQSVKRGGWAPGYGQMFSIVTISQLGKYIPGGVWHFAARISSYKENELSNKKTAKVMVLENLWLVSGALVFGLFMVTLQPPSDYLYSLLHVKTPAGAWTALTIALPVLWLVGLIALERIFTGTLDASSLRQIAWIAAVQLVIWGAMGSSFFFVFQDIGFSSFWLILGGYALSWVAGYVVIFAPGGIGVREFVLVALFASLLPTGQIAIYSVVHRLIYTFVEVGLGGLGFLAQRAALRRRSEAADPSSQS